MTCRSKSRIFQEEVLGRWVEVEYCGRQFAGTVLGETKNMFALEVDGSVKWIPKKKSSFKFTLADGSTIRLDGELMLGRPHERIRRGGRRWLRYVTSEYQ